MEQRPLRLGDVVDDYCPRERRITNHAIVAIVGEDIRQTRCATCDTEHVFKGGQVPKRTALRRKEAEAPGQLVTPRAASAESAAEPPAALAAAPPAPTPAPLPAPQIEAAASDDVSDAAEPPQNGHDDHVDGWLAHRPLIRATLPRTEGDTPPPRPIPEFTMHQRQTRGGRAFRQSYGWSGNGNPANGGFRNGRPVDGNVANGNHDRHGRGGHGHGHGQSPGRGGQPGGGGGGRPGRHRGGSHHNKRSR